MTHTVREKQKLLARVRRIRGQVEAIERARGRAWCYGRTDGRSGRGSCSNASGHLSKMSAAIIETQASTDHRALVSPSSTEVKRLARRRDSDRRRLQRRRCANRFREELGRNNPPQHLIRSTGAAMSTTSWHTMAPLKAHSRSHPYPRPAGDYYIRDFVRMNLTSNTVRRRLRAPTSGTAVPSARHWLDNGELSGQRHPCFAIPRSPGDRLCCLARNTCNLYAMKRGSCREALHAH
jgi:hypothetical protein